MPVFGNLGIVEWVIIGAVVFMLFGSKKLKDLGRDLGKSGKELKKAKKELNEAIKESKTYLSEKGDEELTVAKKNKTDKNK